MTKETMKKKLNAYVKLAEEKLQLEKKLKKLKDDIKSDFKTAEKIDGFKVTCNSQTRESFRLSEAKEKIPEKTFEKYLSPYMSESEFDKILIKKL
jgi:glutamate-1-semialdehyde aminotransferase